MFWQREDWVDAENGDEMERNVRVAVGMWTFPEQLELPPHPNYYYYYYYLKSVNHCVWHQFIVMVRVRF